jgi:hypothetical protein
MDRRRTREPHRDEQGIVIPSAALPGRPVAEGI